MKPFVHGQHVEQSTETTHYTPPCRPIETMGLTCTFDIVELGNGRTDGADYKRTDGC